MDYDLLKPENLVNTVFVKEGSFSGESLGVQKQTI